MDLSLIDWEPTLQKLNKEGFALVPRLLCEQQCRNLRHCYHDAKLFRKTVDMERYRLGKGEYKYLKHPLPEVVAQLRSEVYKKLVSLANTWQEQLKKSSRFPASHEQFIHLCQQNDQTLPSALLLSYEHDGFNRLHQDLYGEVHFPFQAAILLSQPEQEFSGGEMVFTEQTARMQSQVTVLQPEMGDMVIFTTNYRPVKGKNGFRMSNVRHGVSKIRTGKRFCLGVAMQDAKT